MVNLSQLRVFEAVAQTRSFTRAAEVVHLTQPGISKHIKQMEEYYGVPLFDRLGKKVALTQAGEILFEATQEIMASIGAAEQRIEELEGLRGGKLVLGASFPIGVYILPGILAAFRKKYPAVEVTLDISPSEKIKVKVLANKLDLGLVSHKEQDPRLLAKGFMTDQLVVIVPSNHKWATKSRIKPQDLLRETFIQAVRGAGTRAVVEERLREKGIVLRDVLDFGNPEGVKHAVAAGLGVSIQARSTVRQEISDGSLVAVPMAAMDVRIEYLYLYRKDKHLSAAAKSFLAVLQDRRANENLPVIR
jgi:DNA-binding transcriptional LysR family regulator